MPLWAWVLLFLFLGGGSIVVLAVVGVIDVIGHVRHLFTRK